MNKILDGKRVLVVEDEMMILVNIEAALEDLGCKDITAAGTVIAAHEVLASKRFDCVLLDMNLNGQITDDVADDLVLRAIPFAFSTGYSETRLKTRFRGRPVLIKPYGFAELTIVIVELLSTTTPIAAPQNDGPRAIY